MWSYLNKKPMTNIRREKNSLKFASNFREASHLEEEGQLFQGFGTVQNSMIIIIHKIIRNHLNSI